MVHDVRLPFPPSRVRDGTERVLSGQGLAGRNCSQQLPRDVDATGFPLTFQITDARGMFVESMTYISPGDPGPACEPSRIETDLRTA
jgi:hypothetical protein